MSTTTEPSELEHRIAESLRSVADTIAVDDRAFDPLDRDAVVVLEDRRSRRGPVGAHRSRWLWTAAAVAAAALLVVGVVVHSRSSDRRQPTVGAPGTQLEPSALPDGMQLWGLHWAERAAPSINFAGPQIGQLFATTGTRDPVLLVTVDPLRTPDGAVASQTSGTPVTIRDTTGRLTPSADSDSYVWEERGAIVTAVVKHSARASGLTAIDALRWTSDKVSGGFTAGTGLTGLTDPLPYALSDESPGATFVYATGASSADQITVTTCPRGDLTCGGFTATWFFGGLSSDGSAVQFNGSPPKSSFPNTSYVQAWPDGGSVMVVSQGSSLLDEAALRTIAASVHSVEEDHLRAERGELSTRLVGLPLRASADLPTGRVELRGTDHVTALCLRLAGQSDECRAVGDVPGGSDPLVAGFLFHGSWYVTATSSTPVVRVAANRHDTDAELDGGGTGVAADSATDAGQRIVLARIPDDLDGAVVTADGPQGGGVVATYRPAA